MNSGPGQELVKSRYSKELSPVPQGGGPEMEGGKMGNIYSLPLRGTVVRWV